jgi:hypothetical protein
MAGGQSFSSAAGSLGRVVTVALFGSVIGLSQGNVTPSNPTVGDRTSALNSSGTLAIASSGILSRQLTLPIVNPVMAAHQHAVGADWGPMAIISEETTYSLLTPQGRFVQEARELTGGSGPGMTVGQTTPTVLNLQPALTGMQISGGTGVIGPQGAPVTVNITGEEIEFFTGDVNANQLSGQGMTSAQGAFAKSLGGITLVGQSMSMTHGIVSANLEADDNVYITAQAGIAPVLFDITLTGQEILGGQTAPLILGDVEAVLTGQEITLETNAQIGIGVSIDGQEIVTGQYPVGAPGYGQLVGQSMTAFAGRIYDTEDRDAALVGIEVAVQAGATFASPVCFYTGQTITCEQQGIGPRVVDIFGESIQMSQGYLLPPGVAQPLGGGGGYRKRWPRHARFIYTRIPSEEEVLAERERMGILPKRTQKFIQAAVKKASDVSTRIQASALLPAYLQEAKQRDLLGTLKQQAEGEGVRWTDDIFPISQALIIDSLHRKADGPLLKQLLEEEAAEQAEIDEILELWMEL